MKHLYSKEKGIVLLAALLEKLGKFWEIPTDVDKNALQLITMNYMLKMTYFYLYQSNKYLLSPKKVQCLLFSCWSCVVVITIALFPFMHFRVVPCVLKIFLFSNLSFWHFTNPKCTEETGHIIPVLPWIWGVPYGGAVLQGNQVVGLPCIPEAEREQRGRFTWGKVTYACMLSCFIHVWLFVTLWTVCSSPGSSVHGILQARILEWVAISCCRAFSRPRDWSYLSYLSCIGQVGSLPLAPPGKPYKLGKIHSCLILQ